MNAGRLAPENDRKQRYSWVHDLDTHHYGGGKATRDTHAVLTHFLGWQTFDSTCNGSAVRRLKLLAGYIWYLLKLPKRSVFFIQLPQNGYASKVLLPLLLHRFTTIALLHDIDSLRGAKGGTADDVILKADYIITTGTLLDRLPPTDKKNVVRLEAWDYILNDGFEPPAAHQDALVLHAGNLAVTKIPELYDPAVTRRPILFYGAPYDTTVARPDDFYKGPFDGNNPRIVEPVSYGLVWEERRDYERWNQPNKFSLYLAMGLPVIIWDEAFAAAFVKAQNCGICIPSLHEMDAAMAAVSTEDYAQMRENAQRLGALVRRGAFLEEALKRLGFDF